MINALRMRPDRIVVGECRGAEAVDMLTAMNTGHDGSLTTLHANSPRDVLSRVVTMVRYGVDLPVDVIEANAASAFDAVVQTARALSGKRCVTHVSELVYDQRARSCAVRPLYERRSPEALGAWCSAPAWVDELPETIGLDEREVAQWKHRALSR